ncbi:ribonuclease R [Roseomonas cutis]|uniref:ribonuclease R n=1 Tax=Roseomonas cutis TaxID=2897332 RepID=UPI00351CE3D3
MVRTRPAAGPQASAKRRATAREAGEPGAVPSREELLAWLRSVGGTVGKSEIARHFGLTADQRPALRELLKAIKAEGAAAPSGRRSLRHAASLPDTAIVEVFGTDPDGDPLARPVSWEGEGRPLVYMHPEPRGQPALAPGDRVLAKLRPMGRDRYEGRTLRRLAETGASRILGMFERGLIRPVDRRARADWAVPAGESGEARDGDLVLAEPLPSFGRGHGLGPRPARVVEVLGRMDAPRAVSLICIHAHGIPDAFDAEALAQAERARGVSPEGREDLRGLPLVTIDGEDARDFDDAVHAEAEGEGWAVTVAIADVAHYVRPGSALDRAAWTRGNSVYFPDRVVPMLPEALSNGWCSLRPDEDRGCLFVRMVFDAEGRKLSHRFGRGIMRSSARLTYQAVQESADSFPGLYGAFRALLGARERRGTLELDLPERKVTLDADGKVLSVAPRERLDSHRLIEEFMVAANVCAAEELERHHTPLLYRIHDRPSDAKLEALRQFLGTFDLSLPPGNLLRPRDFAALLEAVRDRPEERLVHETVLRSQSQAEYAPDNIGHFGLALPRYAHFTSPIRRYADLVVHRALIAALRLGQDGLTAEEAARLPETGEHITRTERRAAMAERDAVDRYLAAYMADHVGTHFPARISGVTRFGLFVTLEQNGASGIVPLASLPDDRWVHEDGTQRLVGRHTGLAFSLGQEVEVRLAEAAPLTGSLTFHILQAAPAGRRRAGASRSSSRSR